jgi:hypothetical protein
MCLSKYGKDEEAIKSSIVHIRVSQLVVKSMPIENPPISSFDFCAQRVVLLLQLFVLRLQLCYRLIFLL